MRRNRFWIEDGESESRDVSSTFTFALTALPTFLWKWQKKTYDAGDAVLVSMISFRSCIQEAGRGLQSPFISSVPCVFLPV